MKPEWNWKDVNQLLCFKLMLRQVWWVLYVQLLTRQDDANIVVYGKLIGTVDCLLNITSYGVYWNSNVNLENSCYVICKQAGTCRMQLKSDPWLIVYFWFYLLGLNKYSDESYSCSKFAIIKWLITLSTNYCRWVQNNCFHLECLHWRGTVGHTERIFCSC